MRKWLLCSAMFLCALPLLAQEGPHVLLQVNMPSGLKTARVPVLATLDLKDVQTALKLPALPQKGLLQASEGATAVPAQFDPVDERTGRVCVLLASQPAGQRLVKLTLTHPPLAPDGTMTPVKVAQEGQAVTVDTGSAAVTFDPAKNGGLPSKIVFTQGNKTWDSVTLNDRVYDREIKGFRLGDDQQPQVRLTANGPLYTEVQVLARYMAGEKPTPSNARATYTFSFLAGSPTFRVSADIRQDTGFEWGELHFLELYFRDEAFPEYAIGDPIERLPFKDAGKGDHGARWGALVDGRNAIGLLTSAMIYDGKKNYGCYVHGPWLPWGDVTMHFGVDVWAGTADDPAAAISAAANAGACLLEGRIYTPGLIAGMQKLRQTSPWLASLLEKAVAEGRLGLTEAERQAAELARPGKPRTSLALGGQRLQWCGNADLRLTFRTDQGASLVSLIDVRRGREILGASCDLFQIALVDGERRATLGSDNGWGPVSPTVASDGTQTFTFRKPTDPSFEGLAVTVKVRLDGNLSRWTVAIDNASKRWSVDKVTVPSLKIGPLGGDAGDDVVLFPNGFGRGYPVTSGTIMGGLYPSGGCVMQWLGVHDDTSGVYVAQHDPTASTKTLYSTCGSLAAPSTLRIEVAAENATIPGNSYRTEGEVIIGVTGGGWFPMTQHYRRFVEKSAPWWPEPKSYSRHDYPKWLTEVQTWVCHGAGWAKDTVEPTKKFAAAMGVPTAIHWYNWHVIPFDNQYPHYFPTKEGFRQGVADLQQAGIRVMPYINGRLHDKDMDDFRDNAVKYATKKLDGEPYVEHYGTNPANLVPMCVSQPFWQDKINEIVMKLVSEEGVDAVYIDQVAAAGAVLCYDKSHGHPLSGGHWWVDGYWKMLGPLQEKIAKVSPDKMLTTESNAEPYAKYFDAYLMCNDNSDYNVPLFPAVYGGKILMFGTYMGYEDRKDLSLMALRQGKLFVFGTQLWWSDPGLTNAPEATKWLRDLAHLRQQVNEFFVHGQMAAPPVFAEKIGTFESAWKLWGPTQIHTPEVWAATWRTEDGKLLMPLVNLPAKEKTLTLKFDPATYGLKPSARVKIERLNADGVAETVTRQGKFSLPVKLGPTEATALRLSVEG